MNKKSLKTEIIKCGVDPRYFIKKYVKIQHPVRGLISFELWKFQEDLIADYQSNKNVVVLKSRQLGISETSAAYALWLMLFHKDKNILVVATKRDVAKNIIRKIRTAIENLPPWLLITKLKVDNVHSLEFSNGSRVKAASTKKDAGRSEALSLLIVDECAHVEGMSELWTAIKPTVAAGGKVFMLSTPNGIGNTFEEIYTGAENKDNEFHAIKFMWWLHPDRITGLRTDPMTPGGMTSDWLEKEKKQMSPREIAQEYCCNFNASGDNVISAEAIDWIRKNTIVNPASIEYLDRSMYIYKYPTDNQQYFITADVARGDGKDYSTAHIWEMDTMDQVGEYRGQLTPDSFASLLCRYGTIYRDALLVVENNNIGMTCLEHIRLNEYNNVYCSYKGDLKPGEAENMRTFDPVNNELILGITTSQRTRPLMLAKLEEYIRTKKVIFRSDRFIDELMKFVWHNGKAEAMRGHNDDLIMAAALGCWVRDTYLSTRIASTDMTKMMLENVTYKKVDNTQIPGMTKDPRYVRDNAIAFRAQAGTDPMKMRAGNAVIDIGWLLSRK